MSPMSDDALRRVRITGVSTPQLQWALGDEFAVPASVLRAIGVGDTTRELDLNQWPAPSADGVASTVRLRAAYTEQPPHSHRLPFNYHLVPPQVRWVIARYLGSRLRKRQSQWAQFPGWPLDLSADFVADWCSSDAGTLPVHSPTPVLLTHDIDSLEGLRNLVERFLPIEEAHGVRSTNYIVPCAWTLDHGLLREVVARGHDIGVHGYDHTNRTPFLETAERRQRLLAGKEALAPYGPTGYRAPSLARTAALVEDLADFYAYDSSIPTSGGPFPVFNNGCATARPFIVGRTIEIPVSMRRDGTARFLGHTAEDIGRFWIDDARTISAARGTVMLLTHCEDRFSGNRPMLDAYGRFIDFVVSSPQFHWRTPREIAAQAAALLRAA